MLPMAATRAGYKVVVSAAVDPEQREELVRRAAEGDRTLSQELRIAVREHLEHPPGLTAEAGSSTPSGPASGPGDA